MRLGLVRPLRGNRPGAGVMVKTHLVWASGRRTSCHHKEGGEVVGGLVMLAEALDVVVATKMTGSKMTGVVRVPVEAMLVVHGSRTEGLGQCPVCHLEGMGVHAW